MKNVKRILSALVAGALLCTGTVFSTVSAEETYLRGDTNYDGRVDAEDAGDMLMFFALTLVQEDGAVSKEDWEKYCEENVRACGFSTYEAIVANDINGDGAIDATDASYVLNFYSFWLLHRDWTTDEVWAYIDAVKGDDYVSDFVVDPDDWLYGGTEKGDVM